MLHNICMICSSCVTQVSEPWPRAACFDFFSPKKQDLTFHANCKLSPVLSAELVKRVVKVKRC